jgi:hypothetical protein
MCESRKNTSPYPFGSIPESAQTRDTGMDTGRVDSTAWPNYSNFEFWWDRMRDGRHGWCIRHVGPQIEILSE